MWTAYVASAAGLNINHRPYATGITHGPRSPVNGEGFRRWGVCVRVRNLW